MGMERLHNNALQELNAGGVQFVEDLDLLKTLRGGHFSQHDAACGAERQFLNAFGARRPLTWCCVRLLARRVSFLASMRARLRHVSATAILYCCQA